MRHRPWRSITALALVASLGLAAAGCFNPFRPQVSGQTFVISPAPVPTTARDLIMLFKWCWENRDIARYKTLFTDDYRFAFAITDSAGNGYRTNPWIRTDEIISATNLFGSPAVIRRLGVAPYREISRGVVDEFTRPVEIVTHEILRVEFS